MNGTQVSYMVFLFCHVYNVNKKWRRQKMNEVYFYIKYKKKDNFLYENIRR
jgi:hypothetical protein